MLTGPDAGVAYILLDAAGTSPSVSVSASWDMASTTDAVFPVLPATATAATVALALDAVLALAPGRARPSEAVRRLMLTAAACSP